MPGITGNMVSQGIWHPRVKFPRDFGIPTGNLAPPRFQGIWNPRVVYPREYCTLHLLNVHLIQKSIAVNKRTHVQITTVTGM